MSSHESVSVWIGRLKGGDPGAARKLWERYYARLVELAAKKFRNAPRRVADEEDAVLAAFATQVADELRELLGRLEEADLRTIALWKLEGHSNDEIAAKLECVPRTV